VWVSGTRGDATLVVTLSDVAPDGTSNQITAGWLNAAQRALDAGRSWKDPVTGQVVLPFHPFTRAAEAAVPADQAVPLVVEVFPASHVLLPGHRLRVTITTGDAPHMFPTATSLAGAAGGAMTVLRDSAHASMVLLPIQPARP
jgi:predicted acyl esterase